MFRSVNGSLELPPCTSAPFVERPHPAVREFPNPRGVIFGFNRRAADGRRAEVSEGGTERSRTWSRTWSSRLASSGSVLEPIGNLLLPRNDRLPRPPLCSCTVQDQPLMRQ
jgi:hypothetical protein